MQRRFWGKVESEVIEMEWIMNRFYGSNDMAKVDCHDCNGCSSCCRDMGQSIWLDPYDVYNVTNGLGVSFEQLLTKEAELHVEDGLIMPNLRMMESQNIPTEPKCSFLDENGRCGIHAFRPGFCRLFPLGRNYENGKLSYFVLEDACPVQNKSKVKIEKWLGVPRIRQYELFLEKWHCLTKGLRAFFANNPDNDAVSKAINMQFLTLFYLTSYTDGDFYPQFEARIGQMREFLKSLQIQL